jgi:hypothetical protein
VYIALFATQYQSSTVLSCDYCAKLLVTGPVTCVHSTPLALLFSQVNNTLKELNLENTGIGDKGAGSIAEALKVDRLC